MRLGLAVEMRGERAQAALRVYVLQGDGGEARRFAHERDETRGEQRMSAEIGEEVRVEGNGARRQYALGRVKQLRLPFRCVDLLVLR